jgi:hypothetical protein
MGLHLQLCIAQTVTLPVSGGASQSIFAKAEKKLEQTDYQQALAGLCPRRNMDRYRSMMDCLFAEVFPELQAACWKFYDGNGPQLRKDPKLNPDNLHYSEVPLIRAYDRVLCDVVLEMLLAAWKENKRKRDWTKVIVEINTFLMAA